MRKSLILPGSVNGLKVAILGAGMYGTALAHIASFEERHNVIIWCQDQANCDSINNDNINKKYYPGVKLSKNIKASTNIQECLDKAEMIICALPVQKICDVISEYKNFFNPDVPFVSCSKGMIVSKKKFISEALQEIFDNKLNYAVLSGPSFAEEMIKNDPTLVVIAAKNSDTALFVQKALSNEIFRMYRSTDLIGVEIAGALKNALAIGAGIIEGSDFGYNTKAALVTRGTVEMQTFALNYGAKQETLFGLAGIGDLMLTAFGKLSRNRTFGYRLAKGETVEQIVSSSNSTIEGLPTLRVIKQYATEKNISIPIISTIHDIVEGNIDVKEAMRFLMKQALQTEFMF